MNMPLYAAFELSARVLEVTGIGTIVLGSLIASVLFLRALTQRRTFEKAYQGYRRSLGRVILLGLEFLVGADIIGTVAVEPDFKNLGMLGLIVLIRTFLSFSLEVEINGRWPWQEQHGESQVGRGPLGANSTSSH